MLKLETGLNLFEINLLNFATSSFYRIYFSVYLIKHN